MNHPKDGHGLVIDAKINTTFAVGEGAKSWAYPIAGHAREAGLGNPFNLSGEVGHECRGNAYVFLSQIDKYLC